MATRNFSAVIEFPPSVNTYYRRAGHHIHMSKRGREFKKRTADVARYKMNGEPPMTGRVSVGIALCAPNRRKYDIDNRVKAVLDALQGVVFEIDEQVDAIHVVRMPHDVTLGEGHACVAVAEAPEQKAPTKKVKKKT